MTRRDNHQHHHRRHSPPAFHTLSSRSCRRRRLHLLINPKTPKRLIRVMTSRPSLLKIRRRKYIRARHKIPIEIQIHSTTTRQRIQQIKAFPSLEIATEVIGIELRGEIRGVLDLNAVVGTFAVAVGVRVNGEGGRGGGEGVVAGESGGGGEDVRLHCVSLGEGGGGEEGEEEDGVLHYCGFGRGWDLVMSQDSAVLLSLEFERFCVTVFRGSRRYCMYRGQRMPIYSCDFSLLNSGAIEDKGSRTATTPWLCHQQNEHCRIW